MVDLEQFLRAIDCFRIYFLNEQFPFNRSVPRKKCSKLVTLAVDPSIATLSGNPDTALPLNAVALRFRGAGIYASNAGALTRGGTEYSNGAFVTYALNTNTVCALYLAVNSYCVPPKALSPDPVSPFTNDPIVAKGLPLYRWSFAVINRECNAFNIGEAIIWELESLSRCDPGE